MTTSPFTKDNSGRERLVVTLPPKKAPYAVTEGVQFGGFELNAEVEAYGDGFQWAVAFPDGRVAYVFRDSQSAGGNEGYFDIALEDADGNPIDSPALDGEHGWFDADDVAELLHTLTETVTGKVA